MVVQEGPPRLVTWPPEPAQDARHGAFGDGDTEHLEFTMNPGCAPQRIGGGHLLDQSAEFCGGAGATSTPALWLGQPGPESAKPFALPTDDSVCLDIKQGMSPVGPQVAESDPKYPVQGRQQRALPFSLKRRDLHSQRCVLDGNRLMSAEEQADESKHEQQKHWHVSDSFHPSRCQSTRYARTEYWRTTTVKKSTDKI
jgi:hypothetical protein